MAVNNLDLTQNIELAYLNLNTSLNSIQVDDVDYANANWGGHDTLATFSEDLWLLIKLII